MCIYIYIYIYIEVRSAEPKGTGFRLESLSSKWRGCPAADLAGVALFKEPGEAVLGGVGVRLVDWLYYIIYIYIYIYIHINTYIYIYVHIYMII